MSASISRPPSTNIPSSPFTSSGLRIDAANYEHSMFVTARYSRTLVLTFSRSKKHNYPPRRNRAMLKLLSLNAPNARTGFLSSSLVSGVTSITNTPN